MRAARVIGRQSQVFLAGTAATVTMMVVAHAFGSPVMRELERLAATAVSPRGSSVGTFFGYAAQLVNGGMFALSYRSMLNSWQVTSPSRTGLALGLVHGVGAGLLLGATPAVHPRVPDELPAPGAFRRHRGLRAASVLVALHGLYGLLVGAATRCHEPPPFWRYAVMNEKELAEPRGGRSFLLVFDISEEVVQTLREWADSRKMTASFSGIGAFRTVALGYFEIASREYVRIPIDEQVEVLSLSGNVALADDKPTVHAHVVIGKRDGTAHGGHLLEGVVRPTLELIVVESPATMRRTLDPATGLPLLDPRS